jgi:hypothetical protein
MNTFKDRFKLAIDTETQRRADAGEPKLTKTMVWKAAGATSGAYTQWADGSTSMTLDRCFLVAPLLRVNPHWLFSGKTPASHTNANPKNFSNFMVTSTAKELTLEEVALLEGFRAASQDRRDDMLTIAAKAVAAQKKPKALPPRPKRSFKDFPEEAEDAFSLCSERYCLHCDDGTMLKEASCQIRPTSPTG